MNPAVVAEWSKTLISQIQVDNTVALVPGSNPAWGDYTQWMQITGQNKYTDPSQEGENVICESNKCSDKIDRSMEGGQRPESSIKNWKVMSCECKLCH